MTTSLAWWRRGLFGLFSLVVASGLASARADETIPMMVVAGNVYSNVTVINTSATHVFVKFEKGFASFRLKDLDPETQVQLGFTPAPPPKPSHTSQIAKVADDPRLRELQEQWTREMTQFTNKLDKQMLIGIGVGAFVGYILFCFCCLLICRKAEHEPGLLVWIPVIQAIPLFKAAKMSGWNFVLLFVPLVGLIVSVVWCFKICAARKKSPAVGVFLLLPITNLFAFLYLAFADGAPGGDSSSVVKLQYS